MRPQWKLYLLVLGFVLLAVLALAPNSRVKAADDGSIVGTWIATATLGAGFAETELTAINQGGTTTLTSSVFNPHSSGNPFLPPFLVADFSDGYGAWKPVGDSDRFAVTFKRHVFAGAKTPTALYGSFFLGQQVGEDTIQSVVTLRHGEDGDTLEGPFTFQLRNLRGEIVGTGSGTVSLRRLKIEPLAP